MTDYAAEAAGIKWRWRTGGGRGWWLDTWDGAMFYVRRSNFWPRPLPDDA